MCTSPTARTGGRILGAVALVLAMMLVAAGSPASAANSENPALSSGVSANQVRGAAQSTVTDPAADVQYNGTPVVGSGFDYGQVYLWLHNNILYVLVEAYGHPGDSNADGGFNSINGCGATGPGTGDVGVVGVDTLSVNETYIFEINRNCDEIAPGAQQWDLQFTLGGFNKDLLWVTSDDLAGKSGNIVGAYNGTWVASPLQAGGDAPGCDPSSRTGAILFQIPNWSSYFVDVNTSQIPAGLSPARFNWRVDGGNGQDLISEDEVTGVFDDLNPQISITKTKSDSLLCAPGGTTVFTVTVADTGNTPVTGVSLVDDLPAGLSYDDNYVDDPVTAIGSPSYDAGLNRLTWPGFDLQPGESRTISFRALSGAGCFGTQTNTASASGQFNSACEGLLAVGPVQATADVRCASACVQLAARDTLGCAGSTVNLPVRLTNCSLDPGTVSSITATVDGSPGPGISLPPGSLAAGGFYDFQVPVLLPAICGSPQVLRVIANIHRTGDLTCTDADTAYVNVSCGSACVSLAGSDTSGCAGSTINVPVTLANCGNRTETVSQITVTVNGTPLAPPVSLPGGPLAPAGTYQFQVPVILPAVCGSPVAVRVIAGAYDSDDRTCADLDTLDVSVSCGSACIAATAADTSGCAGSTVGVPVTVTNCGTGNETVSQITVTVNGTPLAPPVALPGGPLAPAGTYQFQVPVILPAVCGSPVAVRVITGAYDVNDQTCADLDTLDVSVSCGAACVTLAGDDTSSCPGTEVQVPFRVTNCGSSPEVISSILCTINGTPVVPGVTLPVDAVAAAGTFDFQVAVMLPAVCGDSIAVRCIVNGYDENDQTCADSDTLTVHVGCEPPDIDVEKTASPTQTDSNSTITVVVRNTGATRLNPVQVVDELPPGLTLDAALVVGQTVTGTCGATLDSVKTDTGITWAYFSGFALDAGDSCTISYRVDCGSFDNASRIDTVRVSGWCDGTFGIAEPVTASDTALVVCTGGEACPRTIGFWRQQCAQKGNGSTKVCLEGMYGLWRCVINATGVVQFKLNDGGYETTASLQGLSDADLFAHLCSQLQGPRPMTLRDMTEVQYLGLMLNYCAEALSAGIPVENAFSGTVGAAIDSIEAALNSGVNLGYWEQVADQINNGIGVLARSCPEGDDLFRNLAPCGTTTSPDAGFNFLSTGNPDRLMARAYPNPALRSSGTMIYYNVPAAKADGTVRLTVYDITGRLVRELVNVPASAGVQTATWNLRDASGARVSSGMYFYRLEAGGEAVIQKVLVLPN